MTYQTDETISLTNEANSNLSKKESSNHHKWLGATATGRRLLLAGGFVGTTVTFGLLLKGYWVPTTSLLQKGGFLRCCTKNDVDYCTLKVVSEDEAEFNKKYYCERKTARACNYEHGSNGHRCCTDTDHLSWYPFDLFSGRQHCR